MNVVGLGLSDLYCVAHSLSGDPVFCLGRPSFFTWGRYCSISCGKQPFSILFTR